MHQKVNTARSGGDHIVDPILIKGLGPNVDLDDIEDNSMTQDIANWPEEDDSRLSLLSKKREEAP